MAVKTIRVPKTPKTAFDARRPVSNLLKAQIANLETAAYGPSRALGSTKRARNEGQASALIRTLTAQLHPEGAAVSPAAAVEVQRLLQPPAAARKLTTKPAPRAASTRTRRAGSKKR